MRAVSCFYNVTFIHMPCYIVLKEEISPYHVSKLCGLSNIFETVTVRYQS